MIGRILFKLAEKINNHTRTMQHGKVKVSGLVKGIDHVIFEGKNGVGKDSNFNGSIHIGKYTTLGFNSIIHGEINIGRYCQLGPYVSIVTTNHPTSYLSTYINKRLFKGELKKLKENKRVDIGNDVWIGQNTTILGGVTIGNGAIIAAGSVVTKDVAPYSIVAGVPAKHIKKRLTDNIINEAEKLQWWNMSQEELEKIKSLFFKNLAEEDSLYN